MIQTVTSIVSDCSNRSADKDLRSAKKQGSQMPPRHSVNAPTQLMKEQGYGKGYIYDHDTEDGFAGQNHFPDGLPRQRFYKPPERGFEREITRRLAWWARRRQQD